MAPFEGALVPKANYADFYDLPIENDFLKKEILKCKSQASHLERDCQCDEWDTFGYGTALGVLIGVAITLLAHP